MHDGVAPDPAGYFAGHPQALAVYRRLLAYLAGIGPVEVRVTRSQVAFRRRHGFAFLWLPGRYLRRPAAEVVLSVALGRHDESPRFKEVVQPASGHWMHHLEFSGPEDVDDEVEDWLREAAEHAS